MGIAFDKLAEDVQKAKEKTKEFADSMADNIEDSIMRMTQGLMSFKDVVKSVFKFVANEMVRQNIAKPLAGALSSIFAGSKAGQFASGIGIPKFANGGRPQVGMPSLVGEQGAELFVPDRAGTIVPNGKFGGQTINVTYSPQVNALDPRTAQAIIAENAPTIVGVVRQAFNQNGQEVAI
jgi:phage-related minor tail protein